MTISVGLLSIGQVDFAKKNFKVIPIFTKEKTGLIPWRPCFSTYQNTWTFLAVRHPMIIYAKSFSNPSINISHDATVLPAVCDCGIS